MSTATSNLTGFDAGLPANIDAEKTILGAVLLDNEAWTQVVEKLKPGDFSLDSHARIARVMKVLIDRGGTIDIVTLANELAARHEVEAIGGVAYLAGLTEGLPRRPVIDEYIKIVKDKSVLRRLMTACSQTIARCAEQGETALEIVGSLQHDIETLAAPSQDARRAPVLAHIKETMDEVSAEYASKIPPCLSTGNPWLDSKMGGGYRRGKYTIVAARPKVGKSSFGVFSTAHNCLKGIRVVWFSLEMEKAEIELSLVPYVVDLPNIIVNRHWMRTPEQQMLVLQGLAKIGEWPLTIYDGDMDCDQVCWTIDREAKMPGDVLFILDHFGLMSGGEKDIRKRYVENSERLRKKIKGYRNAALVNLFQLNEVPREFSDKRPQPGDISESKKPLQDCYAAIFLHRYVDKDSFKMTKKANINLALIRGGGSPGNIDCEFNTKLLAFEASAELECEPDENYFS